MLWLVGGSLRAFSLATHLVGVAQQIIFMLAVKPQHIWLSLLPSSVGEMGMRQSATLSLHTRAAAAVGIGVADSQANLRTMMSVLQLGMPMLYGQLYVLHPSAPWALAGALGAAAEAVFCLLSAREVAGVEAAAKE